jgi:hypothetical protein
MVHMTHSSWGWSALPQARQVEPKRDRVVAGPDGASSLRVVALGAACDIRPPTHDRRTQSFSVSEFALLHDGRRVILHDDRGFTIGAPAGQGGVRGFETAESLERDVLNAVLPDDDDSGEEHPWSWLAELALECGLDVTADDLRVLPYEVVLTDSVTRWLDAP